MILMMLPSAVVFSAAAAGTDYSEYWSGLGTKASPYQIRDREDLAKIADLVNKGDDLDGVYFKQIKDIDLEGSKDNLWPVIGMTVNNVSHQFNGVYDGDDKNINNLYVERTDDDAGLFGYVGENGIIRNVRVVDGYVSGTYWCGGIASRNYGIVEYCSFLGEVYGKQQFVGGVVGDNNGKGIVRYCCNLGDFVEFGQIGGGVVGRNSGGLVENCYNRAEVSSLNAVRGYAGGVAGENTANGTINNCYTDGDVYGNMACGAVLGANGDGSSVSNCFYPDWLEDSGLSAVGSNTGKAKKVESRTDDQFASGEVAWELSQDPSADGVWGQSLSDGDQHPHFLNQPDKEHDTTEIYRVSFTEKQLGILPDGFLAYYFDPDDLIESGNVPELSDGDKWYVTDNGVDYEFDSTQKIDRDIDAYAGKRIYLENGEPITHTLTYSPEAQEVDLDMFLKYAEGGPYSEGRFTYAINGNANGLSLKEDKKTLVIPAGKTVGSYTLSIKATEIKPYILKLDLLVEIPKQELMMNVTIRIDEATPIIDPPPIVEGDFDYGKTLNDITLAGGAAKDPATLGEIEGTFKWDNPNEVPNITQAATVGYPVTFIPNDKVNYNSVPLMVKLTVNQAEPEITKLPEGIDAVYNGAAEDLIKPGSTNGGTMKYWLTDDPKAKPPADNSAYSSTIPRSANAGEYYIWYKVIGDENYKDSEPDFVKATISKRELEITKQMFTYNGGKDFTAELTQNVVPSDSTVVAYITTYAKDRGIYGYSETEGAGKYTLTLSNSNYCVKTGAADAEIVPLPVVLRWKEPLTFPEEPNKTRKVEAEVTNGIKGDKFTLEYEYDPDNNITNTASAAGSYVAGIKSLGNDNYSLKEFDGNDVQNISQAWSIFVNSSYITLKTDKDTITYGDPLEIVSDVTAEGVTENSKVNFYINGDHVDEIDEVPAIERKFEDGKLTLKLSIPNATAKLNFLLGANVIRAEYVNPDGTAEMEAVTVTVDPKPVEVEVSNTDKTYDGNAIAVGLTLKIKNGEIEDGDAVDITADTYTYDSANAGQNKKITIGNVTLVGAQSGNYTVASTLTARGNIDPKPIKLVWRGVTGNVYTGDPVNVYATAAETLPDDTCEVIVQDGNKTDAGVGYIAKAVGLKNSNYALPDDATQVYDIDPASLYITEQPPYDYSGNKEFTARVNGVTPSRGRTQTVDVTMTANSPNAGDYTYADNNTADGTYKAATADTNYKIEGGAILTIRKVNPHFNPPKPLRLLFNDKPQTLVTEGKITDADTDCVIQYSFMEDGTYYPELPTQIDVGDYDIWYRVVGDANHNDVAPARVKASIYVQTNSPSGPSRRDEVTTDPDSDNTKKPNRPAKPDDDPGVSPDTGAEINYGLYFVIMCFCATVIAEMARRIRR